MTLIISFCFFYTVCAKLFVVLFDVVFEAAMSWLKKDDAGSRTHAVADILKCVRLPLLAPHYLTDKVAKESLIRNSLPCRLTGLYIYWRLGVLTY